MTMQLTTPPDTADAALATRLTPGERRHLQALERKIEHGMQTFKEVGTALQEVRDSRLYRESHTSFETYCRDRWGLERQRAYQLIGAVEVIEALPESAQPLIRNEATARELVPLMRDGDPEVLATVMAKITEQHEADGKPVTAEVVRQIKADILPASLTSASDLVVSLIREANRMKVRYSQWIATGPDRKTKRNVDSAIRAITQA